MSHTDESGPQDGAVEAQSTDLNLELERIDEEKERLRRLADQLGLKPPSSGQPAAPDPSPSPASPGAQVPRRTAGSADALADLSAPGAGVGDSGPASAEERHALPRKPHTRRPSLPVSRAASPTPGGKRTPSRDTGRGRVSGSLLESLSGFVPAALFDEMKRERDELFFRLTKQEVERPQLDELRSALAGMETEVRRLESEIERRRRAPVSAQAESLRLCYRRWLALRRRRPLMFSDYLACRRTEKGDA